MNYIYDILLNFHNMLYDFYDWNLNDNIINVRKVPLFKISSNQLKEIKENVVKFDYNFLKKIQNRTELFSSKDIKYLEYCFLLCDGVEVLAIMIKNNTVQKSRLLVDEELEVLEVASRLKEEDIFYQISKRDKYIGFKTRKEQDMEKMIRKNLKKLKEDKDLDLLKYIYYECFNEKEESKEKMLLRLEYTLEKNFDQIANQLYRFFQLIHVQK